MQFLDMSGLTPRKRAKQMTIADSISRAPKAKRPKLDIDASDTDIESSNDTNPASVNRKLTFWMPSATWNPEGEGSNVVNKNEMATKLADEVRKELAHQALQALPPSEENEYTISARTAIELSISTDSTMSNSGIVEKIPFDTKQPNDLDGQIVNIMSSTQYLEKMNSITRSEADLACSPDFNEDRDIGGQHKASLISKQIESEMINISMAPFGNTSGESGLSNNLEDEVVKIIQRSTRVQELITNMAKKDDHEGIPDTNNMQNKGINKHFHAVENREEALDYVRKCAKYNRTLRTAIPFLKDDELKTLLYKEGILAFNDLYLLDEEMDCNMDSVNHSIDEPLGLQVTCNNLTTTSSNESRIVLTTNGSNLKPREYGDLGLQREPR